MSEESNGNPLGWMLSLLRDAGIPTGVGALMVLGMLGGNKLLKHYFESSKEDGEENRAERLQLSSEQAAFRQTLMTQIEALRKQLDETQADLDAATARHLDAERRVVEFQLTIARLAAALISSGIAVPATVLPDLGLTKQALPAAGTAPA